MSSLDTLSRLKGIETVKRTAPIVTTDPLTLDTLSRLKGIETQESVFCLIFITNSLDTLSRLKGIETFFSISR